MQNYTAVIALLVSALTFPVAAEKLAGRKLVTAFMDICVLTRGDPNSAERSVEFLGLIPIETSTYEFYDLGKRFADQSLFGTNSEELTYIVRIARSEDSNRWSFVCEVSAPTLDDYNAQVAYVYLPALANLGEPQAISAAGTVWRSSAWVEDSAISFATFDYPKLGASIRFHSSFKKP